MLVLRLNLFSELNLSIIELTGASQQTSGIDLYLRTVAWMSLVRVTSVLHCRDSINSAVTQINWCVTL